MKAVGVKVLKNKLSEYLRLVKTGVTVLVTERDEVVAELRPAHRQGLHPSGLDEELELASEKGEVTLRADDSGRWPTLKALSYPLGVTSKEILDILRKDTR